MKVIALGGAGAMGRTAVRDLAAEPEVEELVIADYNLAEAEKLARELGDKCRAVQVDANRHADLVEQVRGYDVALGTVGPFYKYEAKMIRACVEAGTGYVSICDDYDAAEEALSLDGAAREAGITAVTGVGWTPGITNVLARKAADELDEVDEVAISWGCHASDTAGKAVTLHYLHAVTGMIPSFMDGRIVRVPAGSGLERVRFPEPVGEIDVFHAGHPEPITMPRFINARTVTLKGGLVEGYLVGLSNLLVRLRLTDTVRKKDILGNAFNAVLPYLENIGKPPETCSACRVDVTGKKDGRWTHIAYGAAAHMDVLTGIPAAVGVLLLGRGRVEVKGVTAPEACYPPDEFLRMIADRGVRLYRGDAMREPLEL
ncbi:MAG: saccharopine dehydrogenase NADP-binding domain-containing protein [Actinobacteria bacterium]|nr:saccharopine dehydrogenase NADP-binding domain-containing protein [Actinomycetota bacterium]